MSELIIEAGSFRDKANRVFYQKGEVYRALSTEGLNNLIMLLSTKFFPRFCEEGKIIGTRIAPYAKVAASVHRGWAVILHHDRIPFVSYPYEWTFSMLKDAALLHLELLKHALEEGVTLKDATAFNIQWKGSQPVFIDIPSFVPWQPGQPWVGYRQFCQLFLFPLLLQAHRGVSFQAWMRGAIDGISVEDCSRLLSRDFYKSGVLADVLIHARLQKSLSKTSRRIHEDFQNAGFHKELIQANLRRLTKIIKGLTWKKTTSPWADYIQSCTYTPHNFQVKKTFVERATRRRTRQLVWDLGCNTGEFSKVVSPWVDYVVAVDGDAQAIDALYQSLKADGPRNIIPLTINLTDLTPGLGWLGQERKAFVDRGRPDLILCLALIHHLCITANIPMNEWVAWLAQFRADLIIEFVDPKDPMVQRLLLNKEGNHGDYNQEVFEAILHEHFHIRERVVLAAGNRILYSCEVKS